MPYKVGDMVQECCEFSERHVGVVYEVLKYKDTELFTVHYSGEDYSVYLRETMRWGGKDSFMTPEEWEECKNEICYYVMLYAPFSGHAYDTIKFEEDIVGVKEIKQRLKKYL